MKIMASHSSATPHVNRTSRTNTIINALQQRAQSVLNDRSIDPQSRAIIRYALEINDPWLARLVRRAEAGETIVDNMYVPSTTETSEDDLRRETIAVLAEIICCAGDEPANKSAALLVLMATLESATHPKALVNTVKHLAFTRCGELNLHGMVDAQVAALEGELLAGKTLV
jgi:hypothetical protein